MSEKHLTEAPWKAVILKYKIKDTALQKALQGYVKIGPSNPAQALESLEEIALHTTKLKKANQAVADVADYLDELLKEVTKTKRVLAAAVQPEEPELKPKQPKTAQPDGPKDGADNDGFKGRLISALKKVKAAEGKESLQFVVCAAKPCYGVM